MYGIINYRQLIYLLFLVILPTALLFLPSLLAEQAEQGAWASVLIATLFGLAVATSIFLLDKRFPDKNFIEINEILFGKIGRIVGGLILTLTIIHTNSIIIREFSEFMRLAILPRSPIWIFVVIKLIIVIYAVNSGLEVIARMADFITPIVLLFTFIFLIFILQDAYGINLLPIFGKGFKGILKGSIVPSAWYSEIFLASFLLPYIKQKNKKLFTLFFSIILISVVLISTIMIVMAVIGVGMSARLTMPVFIASSLGTTLFFEHLDILFVSIWILGASIKIIVFAYIGVICLGQTFNIKNEKPLILPLCLLMGILSVSLFNNQVEIVHYLKNTFPFHFVLIAFLLPVFLLSLSYIRRKIT